MGGGLLPSLQSAPPSPPRVRSVVTFRGEEEAKELLSPSSLPSSAPSSALTSLDSAVRRYAAVRSAKAVSSVRLSALLDERRRGPFTSQTLHVAPLAASASLASSTSSLQPAWNGGEAYDWNERLPYPGVDALAEHLRGGDEAKGPLSPSTVSYHRHIRRASLDGRTGSAAFPPVTAPLSAPFPSSAHLRSVCPCLSQSFCTLRVSPPTAAFPLCHRHRVSCPATLRPRAAVLVPVS